MTILEQFALVGNLVYGPKWRKGLARDLGISHYTIRAWTLGHHKPPRDDAMKAQLRTIIRNHQTRLRTAYLLLDEPHDSYEVGSGRD